MLAVADKMPHLFQPGTTWTMGLPDYRIKVNPVRAQELNLSPESISQQAYYALRGGLTNEFYRLPNVRQNTILVRYDQQDRKGEHDREDRDHRVVDDAGGGRGGGPRGSPDR